MNKPEYFSSAVFQFQDLKIYLFAILLWFWALLLWGCRLSVWDNGSAGCCCQTIRNIMESTKDTFMPASRQAVAFLPQSSWTRCTFFPYIYFLPLTLSELFCMFLDVKCGCTTSLTNQEAIWDGFISIFCIRLRNVHVLPGTSLCRD